jgi:hypothetical protein
MIASHEKSEARSIMQPIEYLSNSVKYETDGKRCVITHLKLIEVSNNMPTIVTLF